ncbi:MAG: hypothetical protein WEC39_00395 [Patescibacteria group bacterium]
MDSNTIMLLCPFCVKEGKSNPVQTPKHSVFVPAMFDSYIPRWALSKGFISLEKASGQRPEFRALIKDGKEGKKFASYICREHLSVLKDAEKTVGFKIWTSSLVQVEERRAYAQAARGERALLKMSDLLTGKEITAAHEVGQKVDKRKAKREAPVEEVTPQLQEEIPPYQGAEVGVSAPSRRGSLKPTKPKTNKVLVKEGKGRKPGKNLARLIPDEIES